MSMTGWLFSCQRTKSTMWWHIFLSTMSWHLSLNLLFQGKDTEEVPHGVSIDKIGDDERQVFIIKGDDLDFDENRDFVNDIEEITSGATYENLKPCKERKKVVLDHRKIRGSLLEGPPYDNWLENIKQGENYTTSDVIQQGGFFKARVLPSECIMVAKGFEIELY